MRVYPVWLMLILVSIDAYAWQTYQNDIRNTGNANGTGYFPLQTSNFSYDSLGMDFQPLVADIDGNGSAEIAVFSNDSVFVLGPKLEILAQAKVGDLLGQPALFDFDNDNFAEIVFNSRQDSSDYFLAYQFNRSALVQEFNLTLQNDANFSGIKCAALNEAVCVFKDRLNYVHIVNMASKNDSYYRVSQFNESRQTVPAIGDIDNDGGYEAVFWLSNNSNPEYGFLAFDLTNRSVKWIIDDIFQSFASLPSSFILKGQPVLADLDKDGKLEIAASVFYDDYLFPSADIYIDWFTELFVYSSNGSKLFSRCEINTLADTKCNDGNNIVDKWEGTNPFVLDYDSNGIDDVCFIKDAKRTGSGAAGFIYMALSCYNHSGSEIANVNLSNLGDTTKGTAIAADMNNDGIKEILIDDKIYFINGSLLAGLNVPPFATPIAFDMDGNKGLDLAWTRGTQTKTFLDSSSYAVDLSVGEIGFSRHDSSHINVTSVIRNTGQMEADKVKTIMYNTKTLENITSIVSIRRNGNFTFSALLGLEENQKAMIVVDFDNELNETNEDDNTAVKEFVDLPYVFVSVDNLEPLVIQSEFKNYIKKKLISGYPTENENEADIKVYIGKNNPNNLVNNIKTLEDFEFGYDFGNVLFNDKTAVNPYAALVGSFRDTDGKLKIMVVGNEIEGDIIGVKKFIENQALLLKDKGAVFIGDDDKDAVKIYDYVHLGGNQEHYNVNNEQFKLIVRNALNDEMFNVFDKSVVGNGITLRLRNLKPNISSDYLEYLNSSGMPVDMPVVLAHGLFSNLTTWEVLGAEISNTGRDTWLIEITGGPFQDCDDCIDYSFYNLTDIFVPALLNGVLDFTGKEKIQYVGFSNGCRSALDSLERGKFDSSKVETFVAVGCPGAFEGTNLFLGLVRLNDGQVFQKLRNKGITHTTFSEVSLITLVNENFIKDKGGKISSSLWKFYEEIILSNNDSQPGNVNVSNFNIIQGSALGDNDGIVLVKDESKIYENANKFSNKKKRFDVFAIHLTLDGSSRAKSIITKTLNKQELSFYEKSINLINQSG